MNQREEEVIDYMRSDMNLADSLVKQFTPATSEFAPLDKVASNVYMVRPKRVKYKFRPASWKRKGENLIDDSRKNEMYKYVAKFINDNDQDYGDFTDQEDLDSDFEGSAAEDYLEKFTELKKQPYCRFMQVSFSDDGVKYLPNKYTVDNYFGPLNNKIDSACTTKNIDGCRMLTCTCHDGLDWFKGDCSGCGINIPRRSWAIRYPVMLGGWEGCYCSYECIAQQLKYNGSVLYRWQYENNLEVKDLVDW